MFSKKFIDNNCSVKKHIIGVRTYFCPFEAVFDEFLYTNGAKHSNNNYIDCLEIVGMCNARAQLHDN